MNHKDITNVESYELALLLLNQQAMYMHFIGIYEVVPSIINKIKQIIKSNNTFQEVSFTKFKLYKK